MSKAELVNYMSEETGLTKADASRALEAMMSGVVKGLKDSGKVALTGFATFQTKERAAREGRNPKTGETLKIAACTTVSIKAGSKLKDAVN
ncbi:MAG: HU family DNA-binding protein [Bacilli bacterium]|nr:HU family DNA-binding protein [Bacilli bacterium]